MNTSSCCGNTQTLYGPLNNTLAGYNIEDQIPLDGEVLVFDSLSNQWVYSMGGPTGHTGPVQTTIYTGDGTINTNRLINCTGKIITFDNVERFIIDRTGFTGPIYDCELSVRSNSDAAMGLGDSAFTSGAYLIWGDSTGYDLNIGQFGPLAVGKNVVFGINGGKVKYPSGVTTRYDGLTPNSFLKLNGTRDTISAVSTDFINVYNNNGTIPANVNRTISFGNNISSLEIGNITGGGPSAYGLFIDQSQINMASNGSNMFIGSAGTLGLVLEAVDVNVAGGNSINLTTTNLYIPTFAGSGDRFLYSDNSGLIGATGISPSSSINIYNTSSTLTGNRVLTGGGNNLTFDFNNGNFVFSAPDPTISPVVDENYSLVGNTSGLVGYQFNSSNPLNWWGFTTHTFTAANQSVIFYEISNLGSDPSFEVDLYISEENGGKMSAHYEICVSGNGTGGAWRYIQPKTYAFGSSNVWSVEINTNTISTLQLKLISVGVNSPGDVFCRVVGVSRANGYVFSNPMTINLADTLSTTEYDPRLICDNFQGVNFITSANAFTYYYPNRITISAQVNFVNGTTLSPGTFSINCLINSVIVYTWTGISYGNLNLTNYTFNLPEVALNHIGLVSAGTLISGAFNSITFTTSGGFSGSFVNSGYGYVVKQMLF